MTNIQQLTLDLMLAHNIEYEEADRRARQFYDAVGSDRPDVLNDGWISVEDSLPTSEERCIVFSIDNGIYFLFMPFHECITHWQPLPEPPKDK